MSAGTLLLMALFLFPTVQKTVLATLQRAVSSFQRGPRAARRGFLIGLFLPFAIALFWFGRERFLLLGDGTLILRLLKTIHHSSQIPDLFTHEPLPGLLMWKSWELCSVLGFLPSEAFPVQAVSIACGAISVALVSLISGSILRDPLERFIFFLFVVSTGTSQLFFGYVENYAPVCAGLLLFIWLSLLYLKGSVHLVLPSMAFGVLFTLHLLMLCMAPALLLLLSYAIRQKRTMEIPPSLVASVSVVVTILWLCGYSFGQFFDLFLQSQSHLLPLLNVTLGQQAYPLLSVRHFEEFANLQMLLAPFALVTPIAVACVCRTKASFQETRWAFLALVAAGGITCSLAINLDLGMSRDWDLLAPYSLGAVAAAGFACLRFLPENGIRRELMVMMIGISLLHTTGFICLNATENLALARFEMLPDRRIWGPKSLTAAYEELAIYFRRRADARRSVEYFRRYLSIDSLSSRIWGGLGNVYHLSGDTLNEVRAEEKAITLHTTLPEIYINLSSIYAAQNRLAEALETAKTGLSFNPSSPISYNNVGVLMLHSNLPCETTQSYFIRALELDPSYADACFNAALCFHNLNKPSASKQYFQRYLTLTHDAQGAALARRFLQALANP